MLAVFAGLLVWVPALVGWGEAILPALLGGRLPEDDEASLALTGLAGLFALGALGVALNLLTGLGPALSTAAAIIGLALLLGSGVRPIRRLSLPDALALCGLLAVLALLASGPIRDYDTALYHLQAVAWTKAGPLPAGLANLHRRFGFDSLWEPAAVLLELPGMAGRSACLAPSLTLFFLGTAAWSSGRKVVKGTAGAASLLLAFAVVPLAVLATNGSVPSLSTDLPAAVLTIVSAHFLLRPSPSRVERRAAATLAFFAVTVKLSAAVWLAAVLLAVRVFPPALAVGGIAWVLRGITLSGYLLYPAVATRLGSLPWATPASIAREEALWVRSWARWPEHAPAEVLAGWAWLGPWAKWTLTRLSVLPLVLLLGAGIAGLLLGRGRASEESSGRPAALTLATALASTLLWFWWAPDPRFGYGALFVLAALPLAVALPKLGLAAWSGRVRIVLAAALGASLTAAGAAVLLAGAGFRPAFLVPPDPPDPRLKAERTLDGDTVFVPVLDDRCWNAPLPCTPYFRRDLVILHDAAGRIRAFRFEPSVPAETRAPSAVPQ
ncbi:MAG: LIC_10190 family membrane protein [Acidithiobacillales bacterium]